MSTTIKSFKDLRVWQISESICLSVYQVTSAFPKEEVFGLISQMRRAAVSLPSNIAEGFGRRSAREKEQFYRHALGSLFELEAQIRISKKQTTFLAFWKQS